MRSSWGSERRCWNLMFAEIKAWQDYHRVLGFICHKLVFVTKKIVYSLTCLNTQQPVRQRMRVVFVFHDGFSAHASACPSTVGSPRLPSTHARNTLGFRCVHHGFSLFPTGVYLWCAATCCSILWSVFESDVLTTPWGSRNHRLISFSDGTTSVHNGFPLSPSWNILWGILDSHLV